MKILALSASPRLHGNSAHSAEHPGPPGWLRLQEAWPLRPPGSL